MLPARSDNGFTATRHFLSSYYNCALASNEDRDMQGDASEYLTASQQVMVDILEQHRHAELDNHNVDATLATMVADPYLFFTATLGGGAGQNGVRAFYTAMLRQLPKDMKWTLLSRTVGNDQIVLETILRFTHDISVDWLFPGVQPTGNKVDIPIVIVVSFHNGKVAGERLYWDQAGALLQLGLLAAGDLPVVGADAARKLADVISERMAKRWHVVQTVDLAASSDDVWRVVGGFYNIHLWHPDIALSEVPQHQTSMSPIRRILTFPGQPQTTEELVLMDNVNHQYQYRWFAGEWGERIRDYVSFIRVFDLPNFRCVVQWSSTFYYVDDALSDFYKRGLRALQALFPPKNASS
jgi:Polyketide cyclase / dehydrase and lipid transport/SnoaL-like polyketide cyclase